MSEILNEEIESKESGFSRRRVVKGVVWTVPVLVTAVGAPPASASPGSATPILTAKVELVAGGTTFIKIGSTGSGNGNRRTGSCPSSLRITNTGTGVVAGTGVGHIKITPRAGAPVGVGIEPIALAPFSSSAFGTSNVFEADFTYANANGIPKGGVLDLALTFNYQATNRSVTATYDVEVSLTFAASVGRLSADKTAVTVNF